MNRVVIMFDQKGDFELVCSDEPIRCFSVTEDRPNDPVYEFTSAIGGALKIGVEHVQNALKDHPIGHRHDQYFLGTGHGPKKPPSRPGLKLLDDE